MKYLIDPEVLFNELHKAVGYCGYCGKPVCIGKGHYSKLPRNLSTQILIECMDKAKLQVKE